MSQNGRFSYICKIFILIVILGVLFYGVIKEDSMGSDRFVLQLSDESEKEESDKNDQNLDPGQESRLSGEDQKADLQKIRVLLYASGYSSIYHEALCLNTQIGEIELNAKKLTEQFELLQEECFESGYVLERVEKGYRLCAKDENVIRQTSIVRNMGCPEYRGEFWIYITGEDLVIVDELTMREYLYGVVPSEMPASYEAEALKAQAVCARTFACRYMEHPKYPEYRAALDDSTACQVYGNLPEQQETSRAVDDTAGMKLLYNGQLATVFYYSTSCGLSADITTWQEYPKEEYAYLTATTLNEAHTEIDFSADPQGEQLMVYLEEKHGDYEEMLPWYRWNCTITHMDTGLFFARLSERYVLKPETILKWKNDTWISEEPEPLSKVLSLSVVARNPGGSVAAIEVEGPEGRYLIKGEYTIRYLLCDGKTEVIRQDGTVQEMTTILPSGFFILQPILYNEENIGYSIVGGGYGHGVGMSQNGANEMAKKGMDYLTILQYYYSGTEVIR